MEKVFYPEIHSRSRGVIKRYEEVQQMIKKSEDIKKRYFLDAGEIINFIRWHKNSGKIINGAPDSHIF
ncbi:hypothetical protein E1J02_27475 [Phocaeicola dorei]|nr:hypothetical protein E1J02_27475 [Phocaeicola dorei]